MTHRERERRVVNVFMRLVDDFPQWTEQTAMEMAELLVDSADQIDMEMSVLCDIASLPGAAA